MGNCCKPASSMEWDGDDWSDLKSSKVFDKEADVIRASSNANGKVMKIKILRKELEELLQKQVGRGSAEQVLLRLIKSRDHEYGRHRLWRPVLDTIPEIN